MVLPPAESPLTLPRGEFLVAKNYALPHEFILGQDTGEMYRFQLLRPNRDNTHLRVGSHRQQFYLSGQVDIDPSKLLTWNKVRRRNLNSLPKFLQSHQMTCQLEL